MEVEDDLTTEEVARMQRHADAATEAEVQVSTEHSPGAPMARSGLGKDIQHGLPWLLGGNE